MKFKNNIENLELKLKEAEKENYELFKKSEDIYEQYRGFIDGLFQSDITGVQRNISSLFQLEYFNYLTSNTEGNSNESKKSNKEAQENALEKALEKGLKVLPLELKDKQQLQIKVQNLSKKREDFEKIFEKNTIFIRDEHYPVLENMLSHNTLTQSDLLKIYTSFQQTKSIKQSLNQIPKEKRDTILTYFHEVGSNKRKERIDNFHSEYSDDITKLEKNFTVPVIEGVVNFVGRNFFKMKPYKNRTESKTARLRRTFKIALLKLLRIKYSGFGIDALIKQVDSLEDFESMFNIMQKLIDKIPEQNEIIKAYNTQDEIDDVTELITEAEINKEKILKGEEATLSICSIISDIEKELDLETLERILNGHTDIVGRKVKFRKEEQEKKEKGEGQNSGNLLDGGETLTINSGILYATQVEGTQNKTGEVQDKEENKKSKRIISRKELLYMYQEIKEEYSLTDKKKLKMFKSGTFDKLDDVNEELLTIVVKMEKIESLIGPNTDIEEENS